MRIVTIIGAAAFVGLSTASSFAAGHAANIVNEVKSELGTILADANGMSLYTFDKDKRKRSNCYNDCAVNWPPMLAGDGAHDNGKLSLVKRKDGTRQWAYKGAPLYYWVGDADAGDVSGDGVGGVWHIAKP